MLRSLLRYTRHLTRITLKGNLDYITTDLRRYFHGADSFGAIPKAGPPEREHALNQVIHWLLIAQEKMDDGGFGSYHLASGWGTSYPETTGYIIPTLLDYAKGFSDKPSETAALKAAHFLLQIQRPSGGWQGGRIGENRPEIVFNTGQVMRGMLAAFEQTQDRTFLDAARKGADWLCRIQHPEGFWKTHALMEQARVYDSYVDVPLLQLYRITGHNDYRSSALKNLLWISGEKMMDNGWFEDCDNTIKRNDRPILHTLAYTLDGLIDSGLLLEDESFIHAAIKGASVLRDQLLSGGRLYGRYDRKWDGSEHLICTGAAQMAIAWMKLLRVTSDPSYLMAADHALDTLIHIQRRNFSEREDTLGAIPGSYPIWGRYEPFAFPNWAAKFFADALMMRTLIKE